MKKMVINLLCSSLLVVSVSSIRPVGAVTVVPIVIPIPDWKARSFVEDAKGFISNFDKSVVDNVLPEVAALAGFKTNIEGLLVKYEQREKAELKAALVVLAGAVALYGAICAYPYLKPYAQRLYEKVIKREYERIMNKAKELKLKIEQKFRPAK